MTQKEWNKYQKAFKSFEKASENYKNIKNKKSEEAKKSLFDLNNACGRWFLAGVSRKEKEDAKNYVPCEFTKKQIEKWEGRPN